MPTTIPCTSSIVDVAVYGRGAVVTRNIDLPADLPNGAVDLEVGGITPLSEAGSLRAVLGSKNRSLVALQSGLVVPRDEAKPGPSVERVQELTLQLEALETERSTLQSTRERLAEVEPEMRPRRWAREPKQRLDDGLAVGETVDGILAKLDARRLDLDARIEDLERERDAAALEDAQARSSERMGTGHPTRRVVLRLDGDGPIDSLRMTYVVVAARWWPVYTLRLTEGATRATWWIEGLVTQLSGEDWKGVRLALTTASLIADVRLPELPSLRIGRTRPEAKRGFRPPPPDLDRMFAPFDASFPKVAASGAIGFTAPVSPSTLDNVDGYAAPLEEYEDDELAADEPMEMERAPVRKKAKQMPVQPSPAMPPPAAAPAMFSAVASKSPVLSTMEVPEFGASAIMPQGAGGPPPTTVEEIEPTDAWLDFDSLRIADGTDSMRRGKLYRDAHPAASYERLQAIEAIEALDPGADIRDPVQSRGSFDHRYEAEGCVEVPSDGCTHRVTLGLAQADTTSSYRAVPLQAPEVYREVSLQNPFDSPILDGPVDVYLDGSLLATTAVGRIDRGGLMRVGLGVEDRLRVARNVRVDEETTGLLGGTTAVHHTVRIDLRSSLGRGATVVVVDRMPDSDDRNVEIKLVNASKQGQKYTQADRGTPIRGGLMWTVELPPGGDETLTYTYRINLPSKLEIVGGNRRD